MSAISGDALRAASSLISLSLTKDVTFKDKNNDVVCVPAADIETYCAGIKDVCDLFGTIEEPIVLPDDITAQDISNGLLCLRSPETAKQLDHAQILALLNVATFLPAPALTELLDQALTDSISAHLVPARNPSCRALHEAMTHERGLQYIQNIKKEFAAHLDCLSKTQEALSTLVEVVFEKKCRSEAKEKSISFGTYYDDDLRSLYNKQPTEEEFRQLFTIFLKVYEEFASKNAIFNFSLYRQYLWLHNTRPVIASKEVCTLYQQLLEISVKNNPKDQKALQVLGTCHQWSYDPEKYVKAKSALVALLKISDSPEAICGLAFLLFHENPQKAIELLENAISKNPVEILYVTLAHLLKESGKLDKAQALLRTYDYDDFETMLPEAKPKLLLYTYAQYLKVLEGTKLSEQTKQYVLMVHMRATMGDFKYWLTVATYGHRQPVEGEHLLDTHCVWALQSLSLQWSHPLVKDFLKSFPQQLIQEMLAHPDLKRLYFDEK